MDLRNLYLGNQNITTAKGTGAITMSTGKGKWYPIKINKADTNVLMMYTDPLGSLTKT
jgi:hypothetical protein